MSNGDNGREFENFLEYHEAQLKAAGVPEHLYKAICHKCNNQIFDSGDYFQLLLLDYGDEERGEKEPVFTVVSLKDIKADDPNAVFLIDHALTFKSDELRKLLVENPSVVNRLSIMQGLPEADIEKLMVGIWRYSNFYSISAAGEFPFWVFQEST